MQRVAADGSEANEARTRRERVAVLGAGTMGHGIAQVAALAGCEVVLRDIDDASLQKGLSGIRRSLDKAVEKGKASAEDAKAALGRIRTTTELASAVEKADLVVEAVPEKLDLKRTVFQDVHRSAPRDAVLATNTSSIPIRSIAEALPEGDRARVVGMHFFNPVPVMKLVEVVHGPETSSETVKRVADLAQRMGKETIVVRDAPGFATSRLGIAIGLEAIRMLEEEVASAEDIDKAMTLGYAHPMGPLRLTDLVGLDVRLHIAEGLAKSLGPRFEPPALLRKLVAEGRLGQKSGHGFYRW
ncbi:MAG TPA: 3-hydroxyacyl-CoA dehydrogenase family protein [Candidatus Thermoplasmatota archaeon]|nr:3-hydroxyacyl-CoA dehydrogenase family protein [Candidatus Thermoplasmatota archaeon]